MDPLTQPGRSRLTRRLAIQLGSITALVVGTMLGVGILLLEQQRSELFSFEAERAQRTALASSRRQVERLEADANALVRRIEGDPAILAQLLGRSAVAPGLPAELAAPAGLELLDLIGADGRVVASLHWPERSGLPAGRAVGPTEIASIETPQGPRTGLRTVKEIRVGSQRVALVAGRFRGVEWLREVGALADAAWWFPPDGSSPLVVAPARARAELPVFTAADLTDSFEHGSWRLLRVGSELAAERGAGTLVLGIVDRSNAPAWARLRAGWVGLTVAAALASALLGILIGRRAARPVDQLVRAVDAIAAGKEDYSFPGAAQDELEELAASFSRLQRSLEQQQKRSATAERIAAWREVARHVAHEVKNPLAPIRLTVQNLQRAHVSAPERFDALFAEGTETILEEVDQLARLVGEFSEFARLPAPQRRLEPIESVLLEALELHAADPRLTLTRRFDGTLPDASIDRDQISRVFKNILGNAIEAQADAPQAAIQVTTRCHDGSIEIEFSDDGPGFAADAAQRIFEPYFSTKEQGTGLGMAISYRVIAEHGGEIVVANRDRGGARVTVRLPLTPREPT